MPEPLSPFLVKNDIDLAFFFEFHCSLMEFTRNHTAKIRNLKKRNILSAVLRQILQ